MVGAQAAAVSKHNAFTWQNLQPMGTTGGSGMVSPTKASCISGGPDMHTGRGFAGLRKLCSESASPAGKTGWDIPLFMTVWADRNEMSRVLGHGSCSEAADCARDTCKQLDPTGGQDCAPMANIRERIAAFQARLCSTLCSPCCLRVLFHSCFIAVSAQLLTAITPAHQLIRGDYAWMGYSWQGCAGVDHKRPYYEFPGGPDKCPQNRSLDCSGYVDGAKWMGPKGEPIAAFCRSLWRASACAVRPMSCAPMPCQ